MSNPLTKPATPTSVTTGVTSDPPWGVAHGRRGRTWTAAALDFAKAFPIGSVLGADQFDIWGIDQGLIPWPNVDRQADGPPVLDPPYHVARADRGSDQWQALGLHRTRVRSALNQAASHPRMKTDHGIEPYHVEKVAQERYRVISAHAAAMNSDRAIASVIGFVGTKRRQLGHLLQSIPNMTAEIRTISAMAYDQIAAYEESTRTAGKSAMKQIAHLQTLLALEVAKLEDQRPTQPLIDFIENGAPAPDDDDEEGDAGGAE